MRAALLACLLAASVPAARADEASESRMRMALALAKAKLGPGQVNPPSPAPVPPTLEEQWHAQGWRRDAAGQWYRWLSTPVTPAWSGVPGRYYAVPATLPRGGNC